MAFVIKDTNPQYGGACYFVGTRKIHDPHGRACEAADFGDREHAKKFTSRSNAADRASALNKMAGRNQFVIEEESIYNQQYGRRRTANGFNGFGHLPEPRREAQPSYGGFDWQEDDNGYNGF